MHVNALKRPAEADLVTVCLVPFGAWQGHPNGPQEYGPDHGAAMVEYFNSTYGRAGKPMPIDYGHASLDRPDAVAAGWVWSMEVGEYPDENGNPVPGVWGKVEWTERAANGIKAKEYSGAVSPVIARNMPDPVTGKVQPIQVFNVGMTNMPFMLDKMPQAVANATILTLNNRYIYERFTSNGGTMDPKQMLADAAAALGLPATASGEEVLGLVKKLVEFVGMLPGAPAPAAIAEGGEGMATEMTQAVANAKALADVAALLKINSADVLAKVGELTAANSTAPTRAELDAVKKELAERKADELIANNLTKIKPDDRAFWKERATSDYDGTVAVFAKMPNVIPANNQEPTRHNNAVEVPDEVRDHYRDVLGTKHLYNKEAK